MIRTTILRQRPSNLTQLTINPAWIDFTGVLARASTKAPQGIYIRCSKSFDVQEGDLLREAQLDRIFVVRQVEPEQTTNLFFCGEVEAGDLNLWSRAQLVTYDVTLTHPAVNGGLPSGFLLWSQEAQSGELIEHREAYTTPTGTWSERIKYTMKLVFSDEAIQLNGTRISGMPLLRSYLSQHTNIILTTKSGVFADVRASLNYCESSHQMTRSIVTVTLNNGGYPEQIPVDLALLNASFWDGGIVWDQIYWR